MTRQLLLLELNEVNFEFLETYVKRGELPHLARLIARHGIQRTTSEQRYEELEPWIQWVTAHTGRTFAEHQVFRLGDIVSRDIPQIWELLEAQGMKVGAISPMNAKHRMRSPAFFVPDPWTRTPVSGCATLKRLYAALSQAVNDNASAKLGISSVLGLAAGFGKYARPANYWTYVKLVAGSLRHSWRKAIFLDLLLADVFIREVRRTQPNFASLFLNAAAHIQHHYLFSAAPYDGQRRNPSWYIEHGLDPVLEVFAAYDRIVGHVATLFPQARLMLATGLHQVPHEEATFYWRLKDHAAFLRRIAVGFDRVEPRMSRDFLIVCASAQEAARAEARLRAASHEDGTALFEIENRGSDLFVSLSYPHEILPGSRFRVGESSFEGLFECVVFVALKNGEHNGLGYFVDTGTRTQGNSIEFPLKDIPERIMSALGAGTTPRA